MGRVHQALEAVRPSVGALHRIGRDAVVAPVAAAGEFGDRHDLDRGHAQLAKRREPLEHAVEGPGTGERSDVKLVDDEVCGLEPPPAGIGPAEGAGVDHPRGAVDSERTPAAHRIRSVGPAVETIAVIAARGNVLQNAAVHAVGPAGQREGAHRPAARDRNLDRVRLRCPDAEPRAAVGQRDGTAVQRHRGWCASSTAPSGGRETRRETGWCCHSTGSVSSSPSRPNPLPPYFASSLESTMAYRPDTGAPAR